MKTSEALNDVSRAYVPGVVAHYAKQTPDVWQCAHDEWETSFFLADEAVRDAATLAFRDRCMELIERFKRDSNPQAPRLSDALNLHQPRYDASRSVRKKECAACRGSDGLRIVRLSADALDVTLLCGRCQPSDIEQAPKVPARTLQPSVAAFEQAALDLDAGVRA